MTMQKAGIVIDSWKLDIFRKHLAKANVEFTEANGPVEGTLTLYTEVVDIQGMAKIVDAANKEARSSIKRYTH